MRFLFPRFLKKWWLAGFLSESIEKGDEMNPLHDHESLSEHLPAVELHYGKSTQHRKWMEMVVFLIQSCYVKWRLYFPLIIFTVTILSMVVSSIFFIILRLGEDERALT